MHNNIILKVNKNIGNRKHFINIVKNNLNLFYLFELVKKIIV